MRRTQTPVQQGIPVRCGDGSETADSVGGDGVVGRGAIHSQHEGLVAPKDEGAPSSGRTMAPGTAPLGEPGRKPPMVVGAEERVKRAREDVVGGGQDAEGTGRVPRGEQGEAGAGDREVVSPCDKAMTDGVGVLVEGGVALGQGGRRVGVVGGEQGAARVRQGVVDLEARVGETDAGFLQGAEPSHGVGAGVRSASCRLVNLVQQGIEPGAGDMGIEVAGGGVTAGHAAARSYEIPL